MKYIVPVKEGNVIGRILVNKEFKTKEEAVEYSKRLNFPAEIYELVATTEVEVVLKEVAS